MCAKPFSWSARLSLIHVKATNCLYAHTPWCAHRLHHTLVSLPMVARFGKDHYHPLLMSKAHTSSYCYDDTMPYLNLSWCNNESWHCTHDSLSMHKCGPRISAQCSNAFPTWMASSIFIWKIDFYWLKKFDLESPLIFVLFLKGKQNKKEKP